MPHEGQHAVGGIVMADPFKAVGREVALVQGGQGLVQQVQVAHQGLHAGVRRVGAGLQQVPVQAGVVVPFAALREFTSP
jgi:hypothetical protein